MTATLEEIAAYTSADQIFGDASDEDARKIYRKMARQSHPDRYGDPERKLVATAAFHNLETLYASRKNGTTKRSVTVTSKRHVYTMGQRLAVGDVSNVYHVSWDDGHATGVMKIARQPADADLISAEFKALKKLKSEVPEKYAPFHPVPLDVFKYRDASTRKDRATLVLEALPGFYSLAEIREIRGDTIDARDAAWMYRRLLVAIGTAHDAGLVHGAVTPEHVMVHPELHGLVLIDWSTSVEMGETLRYVPTSRADWYTTRKEVTEKTPVTHAFDLSFAARTIAWLLEDSWDTVPRQIKAFLKGSQVSSPPPAVTLLKEFDELLERLYGPRRFRPFEIHSTVRK